ncbi:C40 family peptidase [Legionella sp. km772]|uniref:C40 family peptidase n=1 Tax=Legionella sp. km772 TaxID=2498111 RepID=UPI000F8DFD0F|nr:NlpC/P60 family protein [Legionella sp. km772]RUR06252.1 peptidoglycan endopeptidase [Legionella sp. km772]
MRHLLAYLLLFVSVSTVFSDPLKTQNPLSISTQELQDFNRNSAAVKNLLTLALNIASKNLGYLYGSADPKNRGMDCSGTIYYLLTTVGIHDVPRSSDLLYKWVVEKGHFYPVTGNDFSSLEFSYLRPGDLLFWSGTYEIKRKLNVTHVMLYLGKNKNGDLLMIGASDGRTYQAQRIYGVSVFDFQLPNALSKSKFLGYSCIPKLSCL